MRSVRLTGTLLLGLSLVSSTAMWGADAQSPAACFVAPINDSPYQKEMAAFNQRITELKKKLRALSWSGFEKAEYKLKDTALLDGGLAVSAMFMTPKAASPVSATGRSEASGAPEQRAETALADLLRRTLFDPDLGPYGRLRVDKCTPPAPDEEDYFLTVTAPARAGLEEGLAYELGRDRPGGSPTPLRIFFHPDSVRQGKDGTTQVQVSNFQLRGKANPVDVCKSVGRNGPAILLLVRYLIPQPGERTDHGNFTRP